jgi:hypothetical protein
MAEQINAQFLIEEVMAVGTDLHGTIVGFKTRTQRPDGPELNVVFPLELMRNLLPRMTAATAGAARRAALLPGASEPSALAHAEAYAMQVSDAALSPTPPTAGEVRVVLQLQDEFALPLSMTFEAAKALRAVLSIALGA